MKFKYNDPRMKERRKILRTSQTPEEELLWAKIRNKKLGVKFWRQYSVGPYILDLYAPSVRLAIEIDGASHKDNQEYDKERDEYLSSHDIKILQFWNSEVSSDIDSVLAKIKSEISLP